MSNKTVGWISIGVLTLIASMNLFILNGCSSNVTYGVVSSKVVESTMPTGNPVLVLSGKSKRVSVVAPNPKRTVYIVGEVGATSLDVASTITKFSQESLDPIFVVLTSPGGSVLMGGQIIAAIESSKAPVYTICHVLCASMAAMIFEYGNKRYIGDRSFVMFHPASGGAEGEIDKMISRLMSMQRYIGKMEAYAGTKAKLTFEQYKARSQVEAWIDGEDAVSLGFADEIATLSLPTNSPFNGLLGAKALYSAIYPHVSILISTYTPIDLQWMASPQDLKWLQF